MKGTRRSLDECWDLARGDAGVTSDADALAQLSWILLLKHASDTEREDELLAVLRGEHHEPIVPAPYRWRDWARALPGADLDFLGRGRATLPDGTQGRALFAALADLAGTGGPLREAVARTLLAARRPMRERRSVEALLAAVDGLDLASRASSTEAVAWYEERLAAVRGDDGSLASLGSVPETLARMLAPAAGETALDPAFGDASYLLAARARSDAPDALVLIGSEPDPDLFVFAMTRLVLRGVDVGGLYLEDALSVQASEVGDEARADVVLGALPPERASVGRDVAAGYPIELRASDPALLYLQLVVRRLRRTTKGAGVGEGGGRAAVVLPDRALSGPGVGARVRRSLLELVRLRAVFHLPRRRSTERQGTSVLLFDRGGATEAVWFYEVAPDEALEHVLAWWNAPVERPGARRVHVDDLVRVEDGELAACDLDRRARPAPLPAPEEASAIFAPLPAVDARTPPLIERPELQGIGRSALFASLTGLAWGVWAYLWLPVITLVAWLMGIRLFRGQVALVDPEPYVVFLGWWGVTIAGVLVLLLMWAVYNILRYSGDRNRRRSTPALALEDVADGFGVDPELVRRLRACRIVTIDPHAFREAKIDF